MSVWPIRGFGRGVQNSPWLNTQPVREELFGAERLEQHARSLARAQDVTPRASGGRALSARLADNSAVLLQTYRSVARAIDEERAITPAAEWLVDNYYLIEREIREVRAALPSGYYRQLPKLAGGPLAGFPRVLGAAWAFVAHSDSHFDSELLCRFLRAYQEVQPLTIGELWAVGLTLRIVLIENLRRLADLIMRDDLARQDANVVADRLLGMAGRAAEDAPVVLREREDRPLAQAFTVQLVHRLRDQDPRITPALTWLDHRLAAQGSTADVAVQDELQRQGATVVTVRNIITSLRMIADVDWPVLFEDVSLVDATLAAGSGFRGMDFPTRNLYRSAIEELSRGTGRTELDIARAALAATAPVAQCSYVEAERRADPGYHLLGGGRGAFETAVGFRPALRALPGRFGRGMGISGYVATGVGLAGTLLAIPLIILYAHGLDLVWLSLVGVLGLVPALDAAVAMVNRAVTRSFGAMPLPALELRDGVPAHLRSLVAVPTLLTTPEVIAEQIERLEVHYLASQDGELHFALLADWLDAEAQHMDGDDALVAAAEAGIARLNRRYGPAPAGARFLLLHRRRLWSASEGRWMGWERKRGKLHELNRLLRGATDTSFLPPSDPSAVVPAGVRYVITLDADTRLPRDTARRLIGKMAHPLNRPLLDPVLRRVVAGHAVLQPRVTPSLPVGREGSLFQRVFSSMSGIDPYAAAASDVYQDLTGEGSYAGKGIYEVDSFEAALEGRVPDATLLSHDLFEGIFAHAGLASDVEVVEEFPARYDVAALRHHRWARGDWQLLPWVLGERRGVPPAGWWKMVDNLRRTLTAPMGVLALLAGFALPVQAAAVWIGFVVATILLPACIPVLAGIVPRVSGISPGSHLAALGRDLRLAFMQTALVITFMGHQAWLMGDAIARTLARIYVTGRHLLEWTTAAQASAGRQLDLPGVYRMMAAGVGFGVLALVIALLAGHGAWPLALPFAALWIAAPAIARVASRSPGVAGRLAALPSDRRALRLIARRTWRYFETFVTAADNMLPPDNFQEDPAPALARRTSPTNIGLYLLSVAVARDFGWVGTLEATERLEATLTTMGRLARFRGHFYNWYGTADLRPLDPPYISTVDSGNLAGHLIALANACQEWTTIAPPPAQRVAGLADAIDLAREAAELLRDGRRTLTVTWAQLDDALGALAANLRRPDRDPVWLAAELDDLAVQADTLADIAAALAAERGDDGAADLLFWIDAARHAIASHQRDLSETGFEAGARIARLLVVEDTARTMAMDMDYAFLLDPVRKLLSIGYRVGEDTLDPSCYDLLASEARLASFVAIAKGDVPARHWFQLGRAATPVGSAAALVSWSGSMFEYLMPSLVMRAPADSLLEQTNQLIVRRQIAYAQSRGLPWGISECAYNVRDLELTYQYSNFGVPDLGLKRGLGKSAVIAPYATALASMVDPSAAVANFTRLAVIGARGRYGFYEALDYTPSRLPDTANVAIIRAYMAHHQGMSIVAIADALLDGVMRARFHAEPMVQATELLLQEGAPRDVAIAHPWEAEVRSVVQTVATGPRGGRRLSSPNQAAVATHLLSNGRYATMLTAAGAGYSQWRGVAITRWREDATRDAAGAFIYLRDIRSGVAWSAASQPLGAAPQSYDVLFNEDRAEITRIDGTLVTTLDVIVSAEDDAEVRRVSITNTGSTLREIDVTSYAELVLTGQSDDVAHPAFMKLFVVTEYLAGQGTLLATRRRRGPAEAEVWVAHLAVVDGESIGRPEVETDRARFLGRGHGVDAPIAIADGRALSNTVGCVLDPIFALRQRVRVAPGTTVRIAYWTMVASSRAEVLDMADRHRGSSAYERAATLAWTQAQVQLHHLDIDPGRAALFQRLAGHLLYAGPTLRPSSDSILRGVGRQAGLWPLGISGDLPILLLRVAETEHLDLARDLLLAHAYWRMKQFAVDVVIVNERASSYVQDLQIALETLLRTSHAHAHAGEDRRQGRAFVLRADLIQPEARALLASVARVVLVGQRGSLADQLDRVSEVAAASRTPRRSPPATLPTPPPRPLRLEFFNGLGGFAEDGREYVTILGPGQATPAPWINVVSNPGFGFQVSTEGSGYTWAVNSRENQITPWSNDAVCDPAGEVFYLRDDDTGHVWSPTALPIRDATGTYVARHGWGYSQFEHSAHGIAAVLLQYVPVDDPIKISRLTLRNTSARERRISVTAYIEWVLGPSRGTSAPFVVTGIDPDTGAMVARNPWNPAFGSLVAFADLSGRQSGWTADRREFVGRNQTLAHPQAVMGTTPLSNRVGAGLDPCAALRRSVVVPANGSIEIVFFLGQAAGDREASELIARYRKADLDEVLSEVRRYWDSILGAVQVKTPDRATDIMLNGWLLYQTLACRVWARSGFYQASGAYGFRDQLQDGMALASIRPQMTRAHLLRAAARQFVEGDVQHWWLPHSGQGVRTHISDDRAWLAYAVAHYVRTTGNAEVLDEVVPFLEGQLLRRDEHDSFFLPTVSDEVGSLYEHCARALDASLAVGIHGLPLIGTGDWNDGLNRVGEHGAGESVWLGWLLHIALLAFAPLADARGDVAHAAAWRAHADALRAAQEHEAWDGEWYRRAWFDDGTPLGTAAGDECRIDAISQSWAVMSRTGDPSRARCAMAAVERELIRPADGVALLFAPPFDRTPLEPGYIKGYPPGIRENGGQYTHAALWSVMAFAAIGEGDKAAALFDLLNPINHARTRSEVHRYKVEPYVVAADVYGAAPHIGRGGWTWYTGSAGWMQRAGVESILGLRIEADVMHIDPCIPRAWTHVEISVRRPAAQYEIVIENPAGVGHGISAVTVDGAIVADWRGGLKMAADGATHHVLVRLG